MFPVAAIPIIIIYNMVHDFQVSGSASAFCQGPRSHVRPVDFFFQGHLFRAGPEERQRGKEGVGWGPGASWKDPPRIC